MKLETRIMRRRTSFLREGEVIVILKKEEILSHVLSTETGVRTNLLNDFLNQYTFLIES